MNKETLILVSFSTIIIMMAMYSLLRLVNRKKKLENIEKRIDEEIERTENYSSFVSSSVFMKKMQVNKMLNRIGQVSEKDYNNLVKIFDNAKNPWGITPTLFNAIRFGGGLFGVFFGLVTWGLFSNWRFMMFGLLITVLCVWYPIYYYKEIAKEREEEWNKIYEFVWVIKNTSMLYDAKKVCIETKNYIESNYPQYKEIITGMNDFNKYWENEKIPQYILKHYNFSIPKEIFTILHNMNLMGTDPSSSFNNLRAFALNKHHEKIQKTLSNVPSQATLASLPFLMATIMIVLLVPMLIQFMSLL